MILILLNQHPHLFPPFPNKTDYKWDGWRLLHSENPLWSCPRLESQERQGFYVSVREMVNTLGCYHPADCGLVRAILSLLSLAPAVFFHPGQAGNQLSCQMRIPTGFFRLAIHFHGNKQTTRCLNSNTRVRWYSCCCLQEIFFHSAAQFFSGPKIDLFREELVLSAEWKIGI